MKNNLRIFPIQKPNDRDSREILLLRIELMGEYVEDMRKEIRSIVEFYNGRSLNQYEMSRVATLKEVLGE